MAAVGRLKRYGVTNLQRSLAAHPPVCPGCLRLLQVAESAGFPASVVQLAREKLAQLEGAEVKGLKKVSMPQLYDFHNIMEVI